MAFIFTPPTEERTDLIFNKPDPGIEAFARASFDLTVKFGPTSSLQRWMTGILLDQFIEPEMLTPEQANTEFAEHGLKFKQPISRARAQLIRDEKIRENKIRETLALGGTGAGRSFVSFATSMATSFRDPINLAASFVPVVSQTKWLSMVQKSGGVVKHGKALRAPASALFQRGAIEGVVGNALVEPFVVFQAHQEQSDYGYADALFNLAAGGVIGGFVQIPVGKFKARMDRVRANMIDMDPELKHAMFQSGVVDVMNDVPIDSPGKLAMLDPVVLQRSTNHSFGDNADLHIKRISDAATALHRIVKDNGLEDEFAGVFKQVDEFVTNAAERDFIPKELPAEFVEAVQGTLDKTRALRAEGGEKNRGFSKLAAIDRTPENKVGRSIRDQLAVVANASRELVERGTEVRRSGFVGPKKIRKMTRKQVVKELQKFHPDIAEADQFDITTKELKQELLLREENFRKDPNDPENRVEPEVREAQISEDKRVAEFRQANPNADIPPGGTIVEHIRQTAKRRAAMSDADKASRSFGDETGEPFEVAENFLFYGSEDEILTDVLEDIEQLKQKRFDSLEGSEFKELKEGGKIDIEDLEFDEIEQAAFDALIEPRIFDKAREGAAKIARACLKRNL